MADIGLNYGAQPEPSQLPIHFNLGFSGTTLTATVAGVPAFIVKLTPQGNISQTILSGAVWPVAQTISVALPPLLAPMVSGFSFDVLSISGTTQNVAGQPLNLVPSNLNLGASGAMTLITGTLSVQ